MIRKAVSLIILLTTKVVAFGSLATMLLGYLFFLSSHSDLTRHYVLATGCALVFTLVTGPKVARNKAFLAGFWVVVLPATALGVWRTLEHLEFYEGPPYTAAIWDICTICTYWVSLLYSHSEYAAQYRQAGRSQADA